MWARSMYLLVPVYWCHICATMPRPSGLITVTFVTYAHVRIIVILSGCPSYVFHFICQEQSSACHILCRLQLFERFFTGTHIDCYSNWSVVEPSSCSGFVPENFINLVDQNQCVTIWLLICWSFVYLFVSLSLKIATQHVILANMAYSLE